MSFFNRVILVGRLTKDPELRQTSQGKTVARLRLAVNRMPSREGTQNTDFFDVIVWDRLAETCDRLLRKGRLVLVDGSLRQRQFTDAKGQNRQVVEVIGQTVRFLDRAGDQAQVAPQEDEDTLDLEETADTINSPILENLDEEDG